MCDGQKAANPPETWVSFKNRCSVLTRGDVVRDSHCTDIGWDVARVLVILDGILRPKDNIMFPEPSHWPKFLPCLLHLTTYKEIIAQLNFELAHKKKKAYIEMLCILITKIIISTQSWKNFGETWGRRRQEVWLTANAHPVHAVTKNAFKNALEN